MSEAFVQEVDGSDGKVLVKKGSGKTRVRKGQPESEYSEQKAQFWGKGPIINEELWLIDTTEGILQGASGPPILSLNKIQRDRVIHAAERLYFMGQLDKCLALCQRLLESGDDEEKVDKTTAKSIESIEELRSACLRKQA